MATTLCQSCKERQRNGGRQLCMDCQRKVYAEQQKRPAEHRGFVNNQYLGK